MHEENGTLPTAEDLGLADRRSAAYAHAVEWAGDLLDIMEAIDDGRSAEALPMVLGSDMPAETKTRLEKVLAMGDPDLARRLLDEYKARLGHVFCESCWR